jgi:ATP-dependent helicase HrpB
VLGPLPIDPFIPEIVETVRNRRALVISASPGAGKTTRVPPALAVDGPVIVLQPRRVAARSIARRIADEQGWTIGDQVGWHVRFERQFGPAVRVLLATEGILTARLLQDPLLTGFSTIVLDEFHERSVHADLGIALAKHTWLARPDLRLVIMSATLDTAAVAAYLDGCPVLNVPGARYPLEIQYAAELDVAAGVERVLGQHAGDVLCFLPGAAEIARATRDLDARGVSRDVDVVPLHGALSAADQDAALTPASRRRIVLATNIAETSLTVPGVRLVIDSGLHKVARYDGDRAIDTLVTERIAQDSAEQRAGRAARLGPGLTLRLWDRTLRLAPRREPEIARIDLSGPVLSVLAWGGDPRTLAWLEAPAGDRLDDALELLEALGAVEDGRLTTTGRDLQRIPLHPRLARILIAARGSREAALACALLSEARAATPSSAAAPTTSSDLLSAIERGVPPHLNRTAEALRKLVPNRDAPGMSAEEDEGFRRAVLAGYPDRVARRRSPGSARVLLASGHGAELARESGVRESEFLVALDVVGARKADRSEALVRMASAIEKSWLSPTSSGVEVYFDEPSGSVRAESRDYYGAIVLAARPVDPPAEQAATLLADAWLSRSTRVDGDQQIWRRLAFANLPVDRTALTQRAAAGARNVRDIDPLQALDWQIRRDLDRLAPEFLEVPSGRRVPIEYREDGTVQVEVKLQEMFGLAETPRVGPRHEPVLISLLAPNGRPVQMTRDLRSFWTTTYADVRKELRGRYPKHPWPEDPWSATPARRSRGEGGPTARTTRRSR